MSDFLSELFEWSGKFDEAVERARETGKTTIVVDAPKTTATMQQTVVARAGHVITNPKSKKTWKVKIDAKVKKNKLSWVALKWYVVAVTRRGTSTTNTQHAASAVANFLKAVGAQVL